jgi:hypothetical protein
MPTRTRLRHNTARLADPRGLVPGRSLFAHSQLHKLNKECSESGEGPERAGQKRIAPSPFSSLSL